MIIGITGYAQSGKDTIAGILVEKHGFERRAFADNIRHILYEMDIYGIKDIVDIVGWERAKRVKGVRTLLQTLGVAARNHIGEDVWVKSALSNLDPDKKYVVTDVRFPNEVEAIRALGGAVWRVERPGVLPVNGHVSETALSNYICDKIILNSTGLDSLESQIESILNDF